MGILDGQSVSQAVTNPAFINKNQDDTMPNKVTLARALSGATISDIQAALNKLYAATGASETEDGTTYGAPASTISNGQAHEQALLALALKFHPTTGHNHDGSAGSGAPVAAATISAVPLRGYFKQGIDLSAVTGSSKVVTTEMTGKTASTAPNIQGVPVGSPENRIIIRQASGTNADDSYKDAFGNLVYGRLTESVGTWTLSFYVLVAAIETAYSFSSASDVRWYYQELHNPLVNAPVYNELAVIPSDNSTVDIITATQTEQGKVLLSSVSGSVISASGGVGTANGIVANADHSHVGVHSLMIDGDPTQALGDATIKAGNNITIAWMSGKAVIAASSGGSGTLINPFQEVPGGAVDGSNTLFSLSQSPQTDASLAIFVDSTLIPYTTGWTLSGSTVTLATPPALGQSVYAFYLGDTVQSKQEVPSGPVDGLNVDFTLSSPPINADNCYVFLDSLLLKTGTDWNLTGSTVSLTIPPTLGQNVYILFLTAGTPAFAPSSANYEVEYHTVSSPEATAKSFTLAQTPAVASKVLVDLIGGGAAVFNTDYTISGSTLSWTGYAFDGLISSGDQIRLAYFY